MPNRLFDPESIVGIIAIVLLVSSIFLFHRGLDTKSDFPFHPVAYVTGAIGFILWLSLVSGLW